MFRVPGSMRRRWLGVCLSLLCGWVDARVAGSLNDRGWQARLSGKLASAVSASQANSTPIRVSVTPDGKHHLQTPPSFLGLSHEPLTMPKHVVRAASYQAFINLLSAYDTGPFVIRWGGNAQDELIEVLDDEQWRSMHDLHVKTGAKFMIGLNLRARDSALAVAQATNAMKVLPPEAVLAFNIGNEADSYTFRAKNKTEFPDDYWSTGYFDDFGSYCRALEPMLLKVFGTAKMVSGPGSSDILMWKEPQDPLHQYVGMLTSHFYTHRSTSSGTNHETFLAEAKMDMIRQRVRAWVRWAKAKHMTFRLEETNTLSIQGLAGASDTLAAALYYIDFSMTVLQAGVHGINFHDSWCSAYSPVIFPSICSPRFAELGSCPDVCGQPVPPMITAPFYGMLFVQMALSDLPKMLLDGEEGVVVQQPDEDEDRPARTLKVYVMRAHNTHELRIVVVRKDGDAPVSVEIDVAGNYDSGFLLLLTGPSWTAQMPDITLAGQQITQDGKLQGKRRVQPVAVEAKAGSSRYRLSLPPASAGLLVVRPSTASSMRAAGASP